MINITKQEFKYIHRKQSRRTYSSKKQAHKTKSMSCVPNNKDINYLPKDIQKLQKDAQSTMTNVNKLHSHGWITDAQVAKCRNLINYNLAKHYVSNKDKAFIPSPKIKHQQLNDTMKAMNTHVPKDVDYALSNQVVTMINNGATNLNANPSEMASPTQSNQYLHHELKLQNFKHWHPKIAKVADYGSKLYHHHLASYVHNGMHKINGLTNQAFDKIIASQKQIKHHANLHDKKVKPVDIKAKFNQLADGLKHGIHGFKNSFNQSASDELHRKFHEPKQPHTNQDIKQSFAKTRMQRLHHKQGFTR